MEVIVEFYETNKEWIDRLLYALISAVIGYVTAKFQTRKARLENLIDGINIYDDNDLVFIPRSEKDTWVELGKLTICRKGKNADVKSESQP